MESRPVLAFFGVVVLIFAWSVFGLFGKMQETIKNKNEAEQKLTGLQQQKDKLSTDISKLSTDEGKQESIREKFGWALPGEGVIVVTDDKTTAQAGAGAESSGFFGWLKSLFH